MGLNARNWKSKVKILSLDVWLLFGTNDNRLKKKITKQKKLEATFYSETRTEWDIIGNTRFTSGAEISPTIQIIQSNWSSWEVHSVPSSDDWEPESRCRLWN